MALSDTAVGDHQLIRRLLRRNQIDAIIHFAGSIVVPDSIGDPLGYYLNKPANPDR
jgi:UDP-glucose 4-epimerase